MTCGMQTRSSSPRIQALILPNCQRDPLSTRETNCLLFPLSILPPRSLFPLSLLFPLFSLFSFALYESYPRCKLDVCLSFFPDCVPLFYSLVSSDIHVAFFGPFYLPSRAQCGSGSRLQKYQLNRNLSINIVHPQSVAFFQRTSIPGPNFIQAITGVIAWMGLQPYNMLLLQKLFLLPCSV